MWNTALFYSNKNHGVEKKSLYRKKLSSAVDYVKIIELHVVHIWRHVQSEYMK